MKKAGVKVVEYRDTVNPTLVTEMSMTLLKSLARCIPPPPYRSEYTAISLDLSTRVLQPSFLIEDRTHLTLHNILLSHTMYLVRKVLLLVLLGRHGWFRTGTKGLSHEHAA